VALVQNEKVMAVEMHGMRKRRRVVEDDTDGRISSEVLVVPFWRIRVRFISSLSQQQRGLVAIVITSVVAGDGGGAMAYEGTANPRGS
jgi:hypothetical protein